MESFRGNTVVQERYACSVRGPSYGDRVSVLLDGKRRDLLFDGQVDAFIQGPSVETVQPDGTRIVTTEPKVGPTQQAFRHTMTLLPDGRCTGEAIEVLDRLDNSPSPKLVRTDSLELPEFTATLRQSLERQGCHADHVVLRVVGRDRMDLALKTGSDRDADSPLYNLTPCDSDPATRSRHGIQPGQVTFAYDVDLNTGSTRNSPPGVEPITLREILDNNKAHGPGFLVYDPAQAVQAPGAQVEFWLPKDPREALLAVIASVP